MACIPLRVFLLFLLGAGHLMATEKDKEGTSPATPSVTVTPALTTTSSCELKERFSVVEATASIGGKPLAYTVTTGTLIVRETDCKEKGMIFFVAYSKKDVRDPTLRPIAFCTNGGPGSSSVWLHLGVLGPQRVALTEMGEAEPPYRLINNDYSILDETDLVFIDPISTGFSRAAPGQDVKQFHGVAEDVRWVGEFIRLYLGRYHRWASPKFFIGESYGTTRAAALVKHLHEKEYIYFNGIALVSSVLNFQTISTDIGNDTAFVVTLPSYTATAWYHKRLAPDLQADFAKTRAEAESFAMNEYAQALMKGARLSKEERDTVIAKMSRLTGLSTQYIDLSDLRVEENHFVKELLRNQRRTVGTFDSRFLGIDGDAVGERHEYDPSADAIFGAFTAAFNHYVRADLKWQDDEPYRILSSVWPWNFGDQASNRYLNVAESLREVMSRNPRLRVFVASGYYDIATPYFATDYTFDHLGLDPTLQDHVTISYFEAGHMMYIHKPSLVKFKSDLAVFIRNTMKAAG